MIIERIFLTSHSHILTSNVLKRIAYFLKYNMTCKILWNLIYLFKCFLFPRSFFLSLCGGCQDQQVFSLWNTLQTCKTLLVFRIEFRLVYEYNYPFGTVSNLHLRQTFWLSYCNYSQVLFPLVTQKTKKCLYYVTLLLIKKGDCKRWHVILFTTYSQHSTLFPDVMITNTELMCGHPLLYCLYSRKYHILPFESYVV